MTTESRQWNKSKNDAWSHRKQRNGESRKKRKCWLPGSWKQLELETGFLESNFARFFRVSLEGTCATQQSKGTLNRYTRIQIQFLLFNNNSHTVSVNQIQFFDLAEFSLSCISRPTDDIQYHFQWFYNILSILYILVAPNILSILIFIFLYFLNFHSTLHIKFYSF